MKNSKCISKRLLLIASLIFSLLAISACGNAGQDADNNANTNGGQTVKIGLLSIDDSFPFYVAEQEGLFEQAGVKVELVPFGSARDKEVAFEAGEIDGNMTDLVVTGLLKKGGLDLKIMATALGATPEEGRFLLLAAPNSDITTLEDLKGKSIGIGNNTIIEFLTYMILTNEGFTGEEIKTENIPDLKLRMETLLAGKDLAAAMLPDPLASLAVLEGAKVIVDDTKLLDSQGQPLNLSQSVVIFRSDSLEGKSEDITKALTAYNQAKKIINENPEKYRDALLEFARVPEALKASYQMPKYTPDAIPTAEDVNRVMNWMAERKLLDEAYKYEDFVN